MIPYLLHRDIPALHRVALRTIRSHLALVHVFVTVLAILPYVGEDRLYMALRALHFFVHAAQRILRLVVVKFRYRPYRPPRRCVVAVFTRYRQRTVWAARGLLLRRSSAEATYQQERQKQPDDKLDAGTRTPPYESRFTWK